MPGQPPAQPEPDPVMIEYLATHDAPCDWCGYNLRGIEQARCPECGGPLDLDFVKNPPSWRLDPATGLSPRLHKQQIAGLAIGGAVVISLFLLAVILL